MAFAEDVKSRAGSPITAFQMDCAFAGLRAASLLPSSPSLGVLYRLRGTHLCDTSGAMESEVRMHQLGKQ